ncbi:kynureninase [Paracidovorax valerianellae]|uniref:Kynureninase n=1 Tax=Paracidovorax valerianellae TaxID=187868 RepID=A0A1G6VWJ3_9BURK|nr:kynureninase [Paracidovorax valerianellae]MDA8447047.1 kynureninase [Paracidovorax valerianellae]SDD57959.1 Kynureninase [Paracidovorax valerianellae]
MTTLQDCRALDAQDPLAPLREHFALPPGVIYLDGNSLGMLPKATAARVADVVAREWGTDLIRSWNTASWFDLPQRLGDQLAPFIGAGAGEVVCTDSTSINLYKVLSAALNIAREESPARTRVVSERSNFPTDLYIAEGLCKERGLELVLVEPEEIAASLTSDVAVLMLTHVNYRTGAMHDMAALTAAAHTAGILTVWDLAHSAGAVPVDLRGADADFSIGCGYKYLNGGPGAPAFVWVHPRHADRFWQPLSGWWGHAAPFQFTPGYQPAPGITRYLCGTQPIISLSALQCGLDVFDAAQPLGGMAALRAKSLALTDLFIQLVQERCAGHGLGLATPREHGRRGSQVCLTRDEGQGLNGQGSGAYAIVQALIARGVIGDFRKGDGGQGPHKDILRFGFTPLYIGFEDVWNAVEHLRQVLDSAEWQRAEFNQISAVT